jgi:ribosomal protein S18
VRRHHLLLVGLVSVLSAGPASAASAPQAALNKTISLTWVISGSGKSADGEQVSFNNTVALTIYVSSAGRVFLKKRVTSQKGRASREVSKAPGESGAYPGSVRFQGDRMVGVQTWASGAIQYTATFDAGFSSCTLSVIDAKGASGKIVRKGPDGRTYTIESVSTSSPSCSVQSGNAFAS